MSDQTTKKSLIKQAWLRVVLFGLFFSLIAALVAVSASLALTTAPAGDQSVNFLHSVRNLFNSSNLWLLCIVEIIIALISVGIFRTWIDRKNFSSLGWPFYDYWAEALTGLLTGAALAGVSALLLFLSGRLSWVDINWDPQTLALSGGSMFLLALAQELIFRGYILNNLLEAVPGKWIALAISAFLFALFHVADPGITTISFANFFLLGMLLGVNYMYTKNLWYSILFHFSWNFFLGPVLGSRVNGLEGPSLLVAEVKGDFLLTGGDFGIEGSVLLIFLFLVSLLILGWAFQRKYSTAITS
jgi:membrane protease YdiL (CAAX protease family)